MSKKVSVNVYGGLGNRMFQVATLYDYAKKHNIKEYGMNSHNCCVHSSKDYAKEVYPSIPYLPLTSNYCYYEEPFYMIFWYNPLPVVPNDLLIQGYFQNAKYFDEVRSDLMDLFQFQPVPFTVKPNSAFIHIRRGDFLKCSEHNLNLEKYYLNSVHWFLKQNSSIHFYVISDDIKFCKENKLFQGQTTNLTYVDGLNELETMTLMKSCDLGGICSNSSFSWWGSYLNDSPSKKIMFPSKWLNNDYPNDIYFSKSYVMDLNTFDVKQIS
jgi:hypothetical protein